MSFIIKDAPHESRNQKGSHVIDTMYGTVTFEYGDHGLTVSMPREWSHLDYGRYTDEEPPPTPPVVHVDTGYHFFKLRINQR